MAEGNLIKNENNRIKYIDPNTLTYIDNGTYYPEDYGINLDLQVIVPDRFRTNTYSPEELFLNSNVSVSPNSSFKSFFEGSDINVGGKSTEKMLTISYTDLTGNNRGNKEMLGITSVNISFSENFYPEVSISFTDVRGAALMRPAVLKEEAINGMDSGPIEHFFSDIFHYPQPRFILSVKGYYGTEVTFMLTVSDFKSSFNSSNGNFDVNITFKGFMHGLYTDIPFNCLVAAPYFNENGSVDTTCDYWNEMVSSGKFVYNNNGQNGGDIMTFVDFIKAYTDMPVKMKDKYGEGSIESLANIEEKIANLNAYEKAIEDAVNDMLREDGFEEAGHYSSQVGGVKDTEIRLEILWGKKLKNESTKTVWSNKVYLKNIRISQSKIAPYFEKYKDYNFNYTEESIDDDNEIKWEYDAKAIINEDSEWKLVYDESNKKLGEYREITLHLISLQEVNDLRNELNTKKAEISGTEDEKLAQLAIESLGFKPTAENFFRMTYAHLDCFMHHFYTLVDNIFEKRNTEERSIGRLKLKEPYNEYSDMPLFSSDKTFVPPFPAIYEEDTENRGSKKSVYPGEIDNLSKIDEVEFVQKFLEGAKGSAYKAHQFLVYAKTIGADGNQHGANDPYKLEYFPTSISDIQLNGENPYNGLSETNSKFINEVVYIFLHRYKNAMLTNSDFFTNDEKPDYSTKIINVEAYNLHTAYKTLSTNTKGKIEGFKEKPEEIFTEMRKTISPIDNEGNLTFGKNDTYLINSTKSITSLFSDENSKSTKANISDVNIERGVVDNTISVISEFIKDSASTSGVCNDTKLLDGQETYFKFDANDYPLIGDDVKSNGRIYKIENAEDISGKLETTGTNSIWESDTNLLYLPFLGVSDSLFSEFCDSDHSTMQDKQLQDTDLKRNWFKYFYNGGKTNTRNVKNFGVANNFFSAIFFLGSFPFDNSCHENLLKKIVNDRSVVIDASKIAVLYIGSLCWLNTDEARNDTFVKAIDSYLDNKILGKKFISFKNSKTNNDGKDSTVSYPTLKSAKPNEDLEKLCEEESYQDIKDELVRYFKSWVNGNYTTYISKLKTSSNTLGDDKKITLKKDGDTERGNDWYKNLLSKSDSDTFINLMKEKCTITNIIADEKDKTNATNVVKSFIESFLEYNEGTFDNDATASNLSKIANKETTAAHNLAMYNTFKLLYDKWLTAYNKENFLLPSPEEVMDTKKKKFIENPAESNYTNTEFDNYIFVDSFFADMTNTLYINPKHVFSTIVDHMEVRTNYSMHHFLAEICEKSKFLYISLPVYNGFSNQNEMRNSLVPNFTKYSSSDINKYRKKASNTYVVMYTHEMSHMLGGNKGYKDDSISDITASDLFAISKDESVVNYSVPAIAVNYAQQNQSYFTNISVGMTNPKTTDQSIRAMFNLVSYTRRESPLLGATSAQDMFSIYSNRSYTCKIDMLGCMNITPLMYFQLNNIPMFNGSYMIFDVKHKIEVGKFVTTFQGVRVSCNSTPISKVLLEIPLIKDILVDRYKLYASDVCSTGADGSGLGGSSAGGSSVTPFDENEIVYYLNSGKNPKNRTKPIEYIIIHYTEGTSSTESAMKSVANSWSSGIGSSFLVGEKVYAYCTKEKNWEKIYFSCSGAGRENLNRDPDNYVCKPGKKALGAKDDVGINIEILNDVKPGGKNVPNSTDGCYFKDEVYEKALSLTKWLMDKYNIGIDNVIRHYDTACKRCPGIIGWNTGLMYGSKTVYNTEEKWLEFKNRLTGSTTPVGTMSTNLPRHKITVNGKEYTVGQVIPSNEANNNFFTSGSIPNDMLEIMKTRSLANTSHKTEPSNLNYLTVLHKNASGSILLGEIVVNKNYASKALNGFKSLYSSGKVKIEKMNLIDYYYDKEVDSKFNGKKVALNDRGVKADIASMSDNNSSGYNGRPQLNGSSSSQHSKGTAFDINPYYNPYLYNEYWYPNGKNWNNTTGGYKLSDDNAEEIKKAFGGCKWGNTFSDYQHFYW